MVVDIGVVRNHIKPKATSTLCNKRKADLIEYIRTLEHNYNVAVSFNENQAKYIESLGFRGGVVIHGWTSVSERLPQEDLAPGELCELVQVLLKDGSVTVGFCNRGMKCWFYMPISETRFMGNHYDMTPVIAWQPLALPPSAAKEN